MLPEALRGNGGQLELEELALEDAVELAFQAAEDVEERAARPRAPGRSIVTRIHLIPTCQNHRKSTDCYFQMLQNAIFKLDLARPSLLQVALEIGHHDLRGGRARKPLHGLRSWWAQSWRIQYPSWRILVSTN